MQPVFFLFSTCVGRKNLGLRTVAVIRFTTLAYSMLAYGGSLDSILKNREGSTAIIDFFATFNFHIFPVIPNDLLLFFRILLLFTSIYTNYDN